jgi:hypothetical protein
LNNLLEDEKLRLEIAEKCRNFMEQNLGATQQVLKEVFNIL